MKKYQNQVRHSSSKLFIVVSLLILLSLACNLPSMAKSVGGPDETARIELSVRETMAALDGDVVTDAEDQSGQDPDTPSETPEPDITDTPTLTPTATDTPTPDVAMIYASANTNCRSGQGTVFQWLVSLQEGEESEAVGIDTSGDYWYIRRPDNPSQFCWLWGKYATPSGPWQSLPVYTPIPTPTPGFDYKLTYNGVTHCVGNSYVQFQIDNIGAIPLESWKSSGTDNSGGIANLVIQEDDFFYHNGCPETQTQGDLEPGEGSYLNVTFMSDPTGHNLTVKIKVCSENGMTGECLIKTLNIKP
jgi:hypothetical protein